MLTIDVLSSTRCIEEIEAGRLPNWSVSTFAFSHLYFLQSLTMFGICETRTDLPAPEISKDYWRLPADATLLDVIYAVRSDESTHRFVNHSLANLNPDTDVNPFALREPDMTVKGTKLGYVLVPVLRFEEVKSYEFVWWLL